MADRSVLLTQQYVPAYRVPFFDALRAALASRNFELALLYGQPNPTQVSRSDARSLDWARPVTARQRVSVGNAHLERRLSRRELTEHDAVVLEFGLRIWDNWVASGPISMPPFGFWGIRSPEVISRRGIGHSLASWIDRRSDWAFVYSGQDVTTLPQRLRAQRRYTIVGNAVDVDALVAAKESTTDNSIEIFRAEHALGPGPFLGVIASLTADRRLGDCIKVCETLRVDFPNLELLVAGRGPEEESLRRAALARPWIKLLGYADDAVKGALARVCIGLLMPGRIGLISLDSLALGVPILTVPNAEHSVEFSYLVPGTTALVAAEDSIPSLVEVTRDLLNDPELRSRLGENMAEAVREHSVERVAEGFADGIVRMWTSTTHKGRGHRSR